MKLFIQISLLLILRSFVFGQSIQVVQEGNSSDSSFYALTRINSNEFWAGGEYGILKRLDSVGNVTDIGFLKENVNILKIVTTKKYAFVATDNGIIYRYDFEKKQFLRKEFSEFRNKCFYDLIILKNEQIVVCGGAKGISKGEKIIPNGFVAVIDTDLVTAKIVWRCYRKFVWSLLELENNTFLSVTFKGLNTKIIKTNNLKNWRKWAIVKGLVHKINLLDNKIWYCGSKNIQYNKCGISGEVAKGEKQKQFTNTGCLWSMNTMAGDIVFVTQSGELLKTNNVTKETERIKLPGNLTLYCIEKISESKFLVVGQGKSIFIVDFKATL